MAGLLAPPSSTLEGDLDLDHLSPLTPRSQLCHPKPLGSKDPFPFLLMCPQGRRAPARMPHLSRSTLSSAPSEIVLISNLLYHQKVPPWGTYLATQI